MLVRRLLFIASLAIGTFVAGIAIAQETAEAVSEPASEDTAIPALPSPESVDTALDVFRILLVPKTAADLSELAVVWQGHLKSSLEELSRENIALIDADEVTSEVLRQEIAAQVDTQRSIQENYAAVLTAWEAKGATPEELKPHKDYLGALAFATLRTTDPRTLLGLGVDWALSWDGGLGFILQILALLFAIWALMFVARMLQRTAKRGLSRLPNMSRLLQNFVVGAVYWATFVLGILIVLGVFGVNVTPLFAVFGGLSFILGFALQETLGNLASGLMIMILKPFDTGDYIQVGSASGYVDEMSVVSTKIRTFDNQIIVVPNSKIWGDVITNVSASAERRVDLVFGIGYDDDARHAIAVLNELVVAHPMCLTTPAPEIFVGELGDSSVNIFCRPWCKSEDYWTVYWDLTGQAKERFDVEGISIPFPQRDVHLFQMPEPAATS